MKGKQSMTLTYDSVLEGLQEYVNRHLVAPMTVTAWRREGGGYGGTESITVDLESSVEPIKALEVEVAS